MNNLAQRTIATIQISFAIILLFCSTYLSINTINEKQLLHDDSLKQFISIYSIIQKIEAQELSEDDDYSFTSEVIDDTEIEEFNDDLESESLDQVGNDADIGLPNDIDRSFNDDLESESLDQVGNDADIGLPNIIETPFNDDLESESRDQIDNNAIECLSNVTIAQSTNNNCWWYDVTNPDMTNDDFTIPPPQIEEPITTTDIDDDFIDPMNEQPIEPIPDPLVTEIPPSEPEINTNTPIVPPLPPPIMGPVPIIIDDDGRVPPPPIIGPDGLPIIRDCCDNYISTPFSNLQISWELKNGYAGYKTVYHPILCNLSDEMKFVFSWIKANKNKIIEVGTKMGIDPVAIAGAIAWEGLENVKDKPGPGNGWSGGPGKVHYKLNAIQLFKKFPKIITVAEEVEIEGYLPKLTNEDRIKVTSTTSGSIEYIGAIMRALADVTKKIGYNIDNDPSKLAYFYNVKDLEQTKEWAKTKKYPEPIIIAEDMGPWVEKNLDYLKAALYEKCET